MKITGDTSLADFIFHVDLFRLEKNQLEDLFSRLKVKGRPERLSGKEVPKNLNEISFGQLARIQSVATTEEMLFVPAEIILGTERAELLNQKAFDVIRFMLFVQSEIIRIGKLFEKIRYNPSPEEIRAGINKINNGLFGIIDWFAKRMGFTDHEQVGLIPWMRIYKCMEMDNSRALYEKRLREIITKKK